MAGEETAAFEAALRQQNDAYGFLARLFRIEVDDALLAQLCAMRYPADTGNAHLDAGYRGLVVYLNGTWERTRSELAADFLHTFIGTTQEIKHVAFPYESVYTSPEHLLMQDARDAVLASYREAKVALVDDAEGEPEDHLAFELEFVKLLGDRAADALAAGDEDECARLLEARRTFVDEHLLNWIPAFADDMKRIARTGFYRALADILIGVVEVDREFLDEALG